MSSPTIEVETEPPPVCRVCGRKFADQHALSSHFGKMHSKKRVWAELNSFFCEKCEVIVNGNFRDSLTRMHDAEALAAPYAPVQEQNISVTESRIIVESQVRFLERQEGRDVPESGGV
jgi:hypothetical protein